MILRAFQDLAVPADSFQWDGSWFGHPGTELIDSYAGTMTYRQMLDQHMSAEEINAVYESDVNAFKEIRIPYLLY